MAGKRKNVGAEKTLTFRLPIELHQRLVDASGERSLSEEMRRRLEGSFAPTPEAAVDPRFADLLSALAYAASAAGRRFPARKVRVSERLAGQIGAESREVEDTDAYWLFEACTAELMDAFRPTGVSGRLASDRRLDIDVYRADMLRASALIIGAALGQLGERGAEAFSRLAPIDQENIAASGPLGARLAAEAERIGEARDDQ